MFTVEEKRSFIEWDHPSLSVSRQIELLGFSKGGLYYKPRPMSDYNLTLMDLIDAQHLKTPFYGSRRITAWLKGLGHEVNRKRIQHLMRIMGLEGLAPGPNTSKSHTENKVYPYLLRKMNIDSPNKVWATDITYVRVFGGFVYLVAVIDWYSRFVLSWELSNSLETGFCLTALNKAIESQNQKPEVFNTDQGCQFTSKEFTGALEKKGILISMDSKGRALDNIMVERLWRSLKYEEVYLNDYASKTVSEARLGIEKYLKFFNEERPHQTFNYKTPREVYLA